MGGAPSVDALRLQRTLHSASSVCVCLCVRACVRASVCVDGTRCVFISPGSGSRRTVGCPLSPRHGAVAIGQGSFWEYRTPGFGGPQHMPLSVGALWHVLDTIRWVFLLLSQRYSASVAGESKQSSDLFFCCYFLKSWLVYRNTADHFLLTSFLWLVANKFGGGK